MKHHAWSLFLVAVVTAGRIPAQSPRIAVSARSPIVLGDDFTVRLEGLTSGTEYQFIVSTVDEWGTAFRSSNVFLAGSSGVVDFGRDAPVRGSYAGADRLGVFWSATRQGAPPTVGPVDAPADSVAVSLVLRQGGRTIDSTRIVKCLVCAGVRVREIRDGGLVAALYEPPGTARHPLVVLIGGSGGGMTWQRQTAAVLASQGYTALALAYFNAPGLPPSIVQIPLEYFYSAISFAMRTPRVDTTRVALIGLSRGAEAALLVGARDARVSAVVAFAPSHVAFMGQRPPLFPQEGTWTEGGKELPFVPSREVRPLRLTDNEAERHLRYLVLHADAAARAAIPVENVRGPILLFSGGLDPIWPSSFMAEMITERLSAKQFRYSVHRVSYDSAGHVFARPGYVSTSPSGFTGGNPRANAYAQTDSWRRTLEFLATWRASR